MPEEKPRERTTECQNSQVSRRWWVGIEAENQISCQIKLICFGSFFVCQNALLNIDILHPPLSSANIDNIETPPNDRFRFDKTLFSNHISQTLACNSLSNLKMHSKLI